MTTRVIIGGNEFVDCANVLVLRGEPLLRIASDPPRVTLITPAGWPDHQTVALRDNVLLAGQPHARVVRSESAVVLLFKEVSVVTAVADEAQPQVIRTAIDLRPIGINVFSDASGLHVGTNVFSGNRVSSAATAISLG
jgi:hypothetical protein